jgi:hypothetical protein
LQWRYLSYHCSFIAVCQPPAASKQSLPTHPPAQASLPTNQPSLAAFHLARSQSSACQKPARKLYTTIKSQLR